MSKNSCKNGSATQNLNAKNQSSNKASDQAAKDCMKKHGKNSTKEHSTQE